MTRLRRVVPKRTRIWRAIALITAGLALWFIIVGISIWRYGALDFATRADCIIVLGAAIRESSPSPVFEERIRHGISLYRDGLAPRLLFTGGIGEELRLSESRVGRAFAIQHGVDPAHILIEERSRTTSQNLVEALALMRQHGLNKAIIVSDPLHMRRSIMIADQIGLEAVSSPTPTSRYQSFGTKFQFLLRELYFIHNNFLFRG